MPAPAHQEICYFCPTPLVDGAPFNWINGNHWTGTEYVRIDACFGCFEAGRLARAPRKPRRPRPPRQVNMGSDWNMLVAFSQKGTRA
jgi:hypothetical protein